MSRWPLLCTLLWAVGSALDIPPGMAELQLPGLRLHSAAPLPAARALAAELARARPALEDWLARGLGRPQPGGATLTVLYFAERESFLAYARRHAQPVATVHAAGFYSGDGRAEGSYIALHRDGGRELATARHELVHWLLDRLIPARPGQPVWYNEGLAVCAEDAWIASGTLRMPRLPRQREELLGELAAQGGEPLAEVLALGADAWLARAAASERAHRQYTASYGAVLFLLNRCPERWWSFLRRLMRGEAHAAAYQAAFGDLPGGLDAAWRAWIRDGARQAVRQRPADDAADAFELGWAWLPGHGERGDAALAVQWLQQAAEGFAATPGHAWEAGRAWLALAEAQPDPLAAARAAEQAAGHFARVQHEAGAAEAWRLACRAWGRAGDWPAAARAGAQAVALAERTGPDTLQAAALAAYAACFGAARARPADGSAPAAFARPLFQRAIVLYRQSGQGDDAARVALQAAQALAPPDGEDGDWDGCVALADEAIAHWRRQPQTAETDADLATAERIRAGLWRPDRRPGGSWAEAEAGYARAARLLADAEPRERLHNQLDLAACQLERDPPAAAALYLEAERAALALGETALAAHAAYQAGWALRQREPLTAAAAFERAAPRYRQAGRAAEEAVALAQAAQALAAAGSDPARIAELHARAARLERRRGDRARLGYNLYQQAWYSEPARQPDLAPTVAAALYAEAAEAWRDEPERAARALSQRARVLTPERGAAAGWEAAAEAWQRVSEALAGLPDSRERRAERGLALHQQAWCLIRGDAARLTRETRALFAEAARLQAEGGDERGAAASRSWLPR